MEEKTTLSLFAKYVSLNILSMLGLSCYILADTYFIANGIGENGLTALNLALPVYSLVNGVGLMLGIGGAARYSIFKVQKKGSEGKQMFTNMVMTSVIFSVLFMILGIWSAYKLSSILGADEQTLAMTGVYIRMILLFSPAFLFNNILNAFVKNDGNPQLAMAAMFTGCMFNIVFDYIFIFQMHLGMLGAVLATGFAPVVGLMILSVHFIKKRNGFSFRRDGLNIPMILSAFAIGIPSLITEVSSGIVMIVYNLLILHIAGNVGVAAYGIIANIVLVVLAIYTGIAQGMQPILSEAYGRGENDGIRKIVRYGVVTVLVISVVLYAVLCMNADVITQLFNRDSNMELQRIARSGIRLYFIGIPFAGLNIVFSLYFASIEKALPAQMISTMRGFVLIVPLVFLLAAMLNLTGIWISFPVTEILTVMLAGFYMKKLK